MSDQVLFGGIAVALMGLGVCMIVWPQWIAVSNRDDDDRRPVTTREIWGMRVLGLGILFGGGYVLYAILTGIRGDGIVGP